MLLLLPLLFYSNTDDDSRWRDQGKREVPGEKVLRMYLSNNMKNSSNTEGFWDKYYIYIG
jgi:hypothetical protein